MGGEGLTAAAHNIGCMMYVCVVETPIIDAYLRLHFTKPMITKSEQTEIIY